MSERQATVHREVPQDVPRRLAVVFFTSAFPTRADGGADAVLARRARALAAHAEVCVVVPTPWTPRWLARLVPRWRGYAETPPRLTIMGLETFYPRYVQMPGRWFVPIAPLAMALGSVWRLWQLRRAGRLDIVYSQATLPDGLAGAILAKVLGVAAACLARGTDVNEMGRRTAVGRWLTRLTVRWNHAVAAVGHNLAATLRALVSGTHEPVVLKHGIEHEVFRPGDRTAARRRLGLSSEGKAVLFVGRLVLGKGLHDLLHALRDVRAREPATFLALVGDGPLRTELQRLAASLGVGNATIFAGDRPYAEIPLWMQAADVLALPSESEGFPNVVREALACGRPVVVTPVGDVPRVVTPSNGRLVPVGDVPALAAALLEVMATRFEPERIRATVKDATWERNAQETLVFLEAAFWRSRASR